MRPLPSTPRETLRGSALVFLGATSFGLLAAVIRIAYARGFSPGQVVGAQVALGGLALWLLALAKGAVRAIPWRVAASLVVAGVPSGLTGAFYYGAVHALDSASLGIVLLFQFTWMGVLVECALERRIPRLDELGSLAFLLAGTVLATGAFERPLLSLPPLGLALGLASAASYTAVIFGAGRVGVTIDPWLRSALLGTGALTAVFVIHPPLFLVDGSLFRGLLAPGLAAALLGPVIPTVCFAIGVPRTGPALASIVGAVELPAAMVAAHFVVHEEATRLQWAGVVVILVGVALSRVRAIAQVAETPPV